MPGVARIVPLDLESPFHVYDRALRQNLALRRSHGPLASDSDRPPTGTALGVVVDENARLREALEKAGAEIARISEGAVQPTSLIEPPRWHVPADDPVVCPSCGDRGSRAVCRCGHIRRRGPQPRPGWWSRHFRRGVAGRTTLPDPGQPYRPEIRWDVVLSWVLSVPFAIAALLWFLQPVLR